MKTVGRSAIVTLNSSGVGVIPQQDRRVSLWIGPTVKEDWQLALYSTPDGTHGIQIASSSPFVEVYSDEVGDALSGQHTIYGTAGHTFIYSETVIAP